MLTGALRFDRRPAGVIGRLTLLALLLALTLSSCGGGSETTPAAPNNLIGEAQLAKYPKEGVERYFLEFWSDLQYQSWANVAAYYSPRFRDFIGTATLIGAKKVDASTFAVTKPEIVRTSADGRDSTVYYSIVLPDGTRELGSTVWRREDGSWQLIYDSRLDAELSQFARNRVEIKEHGALSTDPSEKPSAAASRAGNEAAHLQAEFLERVLKTEAP